MIIDQVFEDLKVAFDADGTEPMPRTHDHISEFKQKLFPLLQ